jgi:hypothetical protein
MNLKPSSLIIPFVWCIFMGITVGSIGIGAVFSAANLIAKPFVCPAGQMQMDSQTFNPYPGTTITQETWYCIDDSTGVKTELGIFPMSLYAGAIYGLLFFVVVFWIMFFNARKQNPAPASGKFVSRVQSDPEVEQLLSLERAERAKKRQQNQG